MKRMICLLLSIAMIAALFVGCAGDATGNSSSVVSQSSQKTVSYNVKLATLAGPTGMGMAFMLDEESTLNTYDYTIASAPDEITSKLLTGAYDIAALPTNVAATLYNGSQGKVKLLALNTLGVLYVLEKGNTIHSVADLKGKKIYVSGQGATPEYLLDYLLMQNGIDPDKDVDIDFTYATHPDLVAFAATGAADVVLLPEPTVTALLAQNPDMRVALDLNEVWRDTVAGTEQEGNVVSMGCVVVRSEFAEKNPEAVANFLKDYEASVKKVNDDAQAAAEKIESLGIVAKAAVALKALPRCSIVFISGRDMVDQIGAFYQVLFDANPKSVGGKLPDSNFYYVAD